ncbi:hypothetical protein [Haloarcula sp. 1CSR25-25]|uniref:hypothetical protein n=1 Tax=Haloarcula sp. 1CSR25-25 TaxID=2862545 RepID=UPI002894D93E|nr:hypothetical protein [Haloarcula sp. 1CSR25-25]MDT3434711.1 hypothetical protein [Haloarcula sp. 1CSR25-25]
MHSGAVQWRVACECLPGVAEERSTQPWERMHSQDSERNLEYFISEDRIRADLDVDDLEQRHEQAQGSLVCCTVCGRLKEVQG